MNEKLKAALFLLLGLVALLGLTVLVYWQGLGGSFVLDDTPNIVQAYIANPDWQAIKYMVTNNASGLLGRSVSMVSFVLTGLQYGLDPWGYKYHNLLLHLLNGVLLLRLFLIVLPKLDTTLGYNRVLLIAGLCTGFWLLHPLLVSTVLYAVQRMAQLSVLFTLLALLSWLKAREHLDSSWRFFLHGWLLFPLWTALAMLSKENGVLILLYVLIIELLVLRTTVRDFLVKRRLAVMLSVFVLLPLLLALLVLVFKFDSFTNYEGRNFTLQERLLTQLHVLLFYVRLVLLPRLREMSLFHDDFPLTSNYDFATCCLLLLFLLMCYAIVALRNRYPVLAFGLAWFLVSHVLESSVFPLELVFEHRNCLAVAGLLLVPIHASFKIELGRKLYLLWPLVLAMFAFMTSTRAGEWGTDELFHEMAVQEHPESGRAVNNYVNYLARKGDYVGAVQQLNKLVELDPRDSAAWLHLQAIKCYRGERDEVALSTARQLLGEYPVSVYTHNSIQNLTHLVVDQGCEAVTLDELEALIDTALALPQNQAHQYNNAYLHRARGLIAFAKGYYAQGYSYFRSAHEISGDLELLIELMQKQLQFSRLEDAQETMVLVEQQNSRQFGMEQYQVNQAHAMLDRFLMVILEARQQSNTQVAPESADTVMPLDVIPTGEEEVLPAANE